MFAVRISVRFSVEYVLAVKTNFLQNNKDYIILYINIWIMLIFIFFTVWMTVVFEGLINLRIDYWLPLSGVCVGRWVSWPDSQDGRHVWNPDIWLYFPRPLEGKLPAWHQTVGGNNLWPVSSDPAVCYDLWPLTPSLLPCRTVVCWLRARWSWLIMWSVLELQTTWSMSDPTWNTAAGSTRLT